jgi:hypothetical protein
MGHCGESIFFAGFKTCLINALVNTVCMHTLFSITTPFKDIGKLLKKLMCNALVAVLAHSIS